MLRGIQRSRPWGEPGTDPAARWGRGTRAVAVGRGLCTPRPDRRIPELVDRRHPGPMV